MFVVLGPREYMWRSGKHFFYFNYCTTSILTKKACFTFVSLLVSLLSLQSWKKPTILTGWTVFKIDNDGNWIVLVETTLLPFMLISNKFSRTLNSVIHYFQR